MVVATPGDPVEARAIAKISAEYDGPMYIRLGKAGEEIAHTEETIILQLGDICPIRIKEGNKAAVISCGNILDASRHQIEDNNLLYDLYSTPFVKPMNVNQLKDIVESHPEGIITIEEHQKSCGMGSAIVEIISDLYEDGKLTVYPKVKRIAIPDEFVGVVGTQNYLREYEHLSLL